MRSTTTNERRLLTETPDTHLGQRMQAYIAKEAARPCKQWIHEVLSSKREADRVKLRTDTFVLLPDVDCISKRTRRHDREGLAGLGALSNYPITNPLYFWQGVERDKISRRHFHAPAIGHNFHWLAVVTDTSLRTLRDLRGEHVPMLESLHTQACQKIFEECGAEAGQVLAYVHYPPSVYQLHIHFKNLSGHNVFHDTFRVHPLLSIINNLKIDPEFYSKSCLQLPVYTHTELYSALNTALNPACCTATSLGSTPSTPDAADGTATPSATPDSPM
jgi:hypothetical protein